MDTKIKLLRHYDRVQGVLNGHFLPPILADIDVVSGLCNLNCEWCAQRASQETKKVTYLPVATMKAIGGFSKNWGIKAWRIAGDSEPTLNRDIHKLFRSGDENGIEMGLITNGVLLDTVKDLHLLRWVGVSLDATTARTWSRLKHSSESNFDRIIHNIRKIRSTMPDVEVCIKYIRWSREKHLGRNDLSAKPLEVNVLDNEFANQNDNFKDAELLPAMAEELGCTYILKDALPKNCNTYYRFETCRATPLYATFGADHKFYLCCDVRNGLILTDDYTRNNWNELIELWGGSKHKQIISSIQPNRCKYCTKEWLNSIIENIILDGKYTREYQVNFI